MNNFHMKHFEITYYCGPFAEFIVRDEIIADIAKNGITLVPLGYDTATNKLALSILRRYGLKAIVSDPRIYGVYENNKIAAADGVVKAVVEDYKGFDNIIGWDIKDEPGAETFPVLAAIVRAFRRYSPDMETTINLFPNYATPEQLGSSDYISHLEEFVNIVDPHLLSYDHYHFLGRQNRRAILDDVGDERERLVRLAAEKTENREGFFENIEDFRAIACKYDIDPMLIVLLTEHGPYRNLTRAELYWEVNMCLAYGMKRISYFTYWEPPYNEHWQWANAMCDTEGKKMPHYYDVQAINSRILPVGNHLFATNTEAVFHIGVPEKGTRAFQGYGAISSIDGEDGVVGFFADGSVYLVNRDFTNANTFTVHSDKKLTKMENGVFVDLADNTITLGAGEAVLLKA